MRERGGPHGCSSSVRQLLWAGAVLGEGWADFVYAKPGVPCSNAVKHNVFSSCFTLVTLFGCRKSVKSVEMKVKMKYNERRPG